MKAIRLIHQSFISPIKTGSPWDTDPQAAECPHVVIKDGLACLTLSSATCTCTQMITPWHGQPESRLNPTVVCLQPCSNLALGFRLKNSGDLEWWLDIYSSKTYMLSICTICTRADYFRHMLFILISCIQLKKKKKKDLQVESRGGGGILIGLSGGKVQPSLSLFLCVDVYREEILPS